MKSDRIRCASIFNKISVGLSSTDPRMSRPRSWRARMGTSLAGWIRVLRRDETRRESKEPRTSNRCELWRDGYGPMIKKRSGSRHLVQPPLRPPGPSHRIRLACGRMFHAMQAAGWKRDSRWLLLACGSSRAEAEQGGVGLAGKEDDVPC